MQRPIEKFGWENLQEYDKSIGSSKKLIRFFKSDVGFIYIRFDGKVEIDVVSDDYTDSSLSLEELQAIYETALEIKRETEMEEKILCNRCENTCYYGFIKCDNFKERRKENESMDFIKEM